MFYETIASWDPKEAVMKSQPGILMNGVLNGKNPYQHYYTRSELLSKATIEDLGHYHWRIPMKKAVLKMSKKAKRFMMQAMLLAPRYRGFGKPGIWSV